MRHRNFRLYLASTGVSSVARVGQELALGWLAVQVAIRDGNPALGGVYIGLVSIASTIPALTFGLFAGVLADRMDRRVLLVRSRLGYAVATALLAGLVLTDLVNIGVLMVCSGLLGASYAFDPPGRQALLTSVVPRPQLFGAMGLTRALDQASHTVGPFLAGALIVPIGVGGVMLASAASTLSSVAALIPIALSPVANVRPSSVFGSLREGLEHMRRDETARWLLLLLAVFVLLANSSSRHLLPAMAVESLGVGAVELSWMLGASGVGSLLGALMLGASAGLPRRGLFILGSMVGLGMLLALLGLQRELIPTLLVLGAIGSLQQLFVGTNAVTLLLAAPDRLRGRVMGMQALTWTTCGPVGVLILGTLGAFVGISSAIVIAGIGLALVALATTRVAAVSGLKGAHDKDVLAQGAALVEVAPGYD